MPDNHERKKRVEVRFSEKEMETVSKKAENVGLTEGQYIRMAVLNCKVGRKKL